MQTVKPLSSLLIVFTICLSNIASNAQNKLGAYILDDRALNEFAPNIYTGSDAQSISRWTKKWNVKRVEEGMIPSTDERYVVYAYNLLRYWFGPYQTAQEQQAVLNKLDNLRNSAPELASHRASISIFPLYLRAGQKVGFSDFIEFADGNPVLIISPDEIKDVRKDLDGKLKAVEQVTPGVLKDLGDINKLKPLEDGIKGTGLGADGAKKMKDLKEKYSEGEPSEGKPGKSKKGNGLEGPFPASYSFSKWFATLVDIVLDIVDYVYCSGQCRQYLEKALTLAYMIMPDVMDRIASTLAKMQDKITPDNVDDALNQVSDVVRYAKMLYDDLKKLESLLNNPNFNELLTEMDLQGALDKLDKYGLETGKVRKACNYIPCELISIKNIQNIDKYTDKIEKWVKDKAVDELVNQSGKFLKKSGIPVLENLDPGAFRDLYKDKDWEKFSRTQAEKMFCPNVPARYGGDCETFISGDYKGAAISAVSNAIEEQTGLSAVGIQNLICSLEKGEYEKALREAAKIPLRKYGDYFGVYENNIQRFLDDPKRYKSEIKDAA